MREKAGAKEDSAAAVGRGFPWKVVDVRPLADYRLRVRFADGTEGDVDTKELVFGADAGVFEALRDPVTFARVRVEHGAVTWPGELDLAPDAMYEEIKAKGQWVLK
jgi:hypothetical protein